MSETSAKEEIVPNNESQIKNDSKIEINIVNEKGAIEIDLVNKESKLEDISASPVKDVEKNIRNKNGPKSTWVYMQQGIPQYQNPPQQYEYYVVYNPELRNYFVRLVFFLVFLMLVYTAAMTTLFRYINVLQQFLFSFIGLVFVLCALVTVFAMHYVMFCSACSRRVPCNYICLVVTANCMGFITSWVTFRYRTDILLIVISVTALVVLVCLIIACTKFDFTKYILYLIIAGVVMGVLSLGFIIASFVFGLYHKPLHIALIFIGTIFSCMGLIIELQMILGGKTIELGEDDYALGAFMLYLSIIEIFFKLLALTGLIGDQ